ncbi:thioredoxin domain-containing protein [Microbulbifer sp. TYP-18]|uniref:thioredoxin domain-containing protein n=1 Tax=Microbulbifer sp. TYP-18 TaxID=3230024 RepID=UPI0034C695B7
MRSLLSSLKAYFISLVLILFLFICIACEREDSKFSDSEPNEVEVVAKIDNVNITLSEVDKKIILKRHDLYLAEYQLRFNTLTAIVEDHIQARPPGTDKAVVEWLLPYPEPPRLKLDLSGRSLRGNPNAPIKMAVFCSYQSVHCARLNLVLRKLLNDYAGWIAVVPFDFPMDYHRQAKAAALAVRCADTRDLAWLYTDGIYARAKEMADKPIEQLASQIGISPESFKGCLERKDLQTAIAKDIALAQEMGLRSVPVVFVNGLYVKGPMPYEHYAMWIERESERLGFSAADPHPEAASFRTASAGLSETLLPLILTGTSISSDQDNSTALIAVRTNPPQAFSIGDMLLAGVELLSIERQYVILGTPSGRERLSLKGEDGTYMQVLLTGDIERDDATMRSIEQLEGSTSKLIEPSAVVPLGREWLQQQLQSRAELEEKFVSAEHVVDGQNLLKLEDIGGNEFFTALGFEEGDVVLRVNDTWVHSGQNQLWEALSSGQVIDVTFMRKGLPQRYQYIVQEKGYFEQSEGDQ